MVKSKLFITLILCAALVTIFFTSCSEDEKNPTGQSDNFDIVGTWEVTEIEGAGPVDGSNSTWIFKSDGNYTWFLELHTYHLNAAGDYNLDGKALYCEVFSVIVGSSTVNITTSEHTFSFLDGDGDRWTYNRAP